MWCPLRWRGACFSSPLLNANARYTVVALVSQLAVGPHHLRSTPSRRRLVAVSSPPRLSHDRILFPRDSCSLLPALSLVDQGWNPSEFQRYGSRNHTSLLPLHGHYHQLVNAYTHSRGAHRIVKGSRTSRLYSMQSAFRPTLWCPVYGSASPFCRRKHMLPCVHNCKLQSSSVTLWH